LDGARSIRLLSAPTAEQEVANNALAVRKTHSPAVPPILEKSKARAVFYPLNERNLMVFFTLFQLDTDIWLKKGSTFQGEIPLGIPDRWMDTKTAQKRRITLYKRF
jgi:hypothetical protein